MYLSSSSLTLKHMRRCLYLFVMFLFLAMPSQLSAGNLCSKLLESSFQALSVEASRKVRDFFNPQILNRMDFNDRKLLRNVVLSPYTISASQEAQLKAVGEKLDISGFVERVKKIKSGNKVKRWVFALHSLTNTGTHVPGKTHRRNSLWQKALGTLSDTISITAETIVWLLNPVPRDNYIYNGDIRKIYKRVADNPNYKLNANELSSLEEEGLIRDIELYRQIQVSSSVSRRGYKRVTTILFKKGPQAASFLTVLLLLDAGQAVPVKQYMEKVELERESRVEIILDTTGFPHTALRIDDLVYSPSQAIVTVRPLNDYLGKADDILLPRSLITIDLNLSTAEAELVKSEFENIVWKNYYNVTGLHDCTTVVSDILQKTLGMGVPSHFSSSPSAAMGWWRSEGLLGNARIGQMEAINLASDNQGLYRMGAQSMSVLSQSIEAKLFYFLAPQVQKAQEQLRAKRELYWQSETYKKKIEDMEKQHYAEVSESPQVKSIERLIRIQKLKLSYLTKPALDQKIAQLAQEIDNFYRDRVQLLDSSIAREKSTTLITAFESQKRALSSVRADLLEKLSLLPGSHQDIKPEEHSEKDAKKVKDQNTR